jgi:hypothetical protein
LDEGEGVRKSAAEQGFDGLEKLFFKGHRVCFYGGLFSILGDRTSGKDICDPPYSVERRNLL